MEINPVNVMKKFDLFSEHWTPKILGEFNGQHLKIAKVKDEFVWHDHKTEDELFLIFKGTLYIDFRDKTVELNPGEFLVVPKGVEHRPRTNGEEVFIMLIEPKSIQHTGEVVHEKTVTQMDWI